MRMPGDIVFAVGALLMAWDFIVKLGPLYPRLAVVCCQARAHR
jgi:nitric oxide reductase subunit B